MSEPKAQNIGSFDVTPAWEQKSESHPLLTALGIECGCGFCQLAKGGHL